MTRSFTLFSVNMSEHLAAAIRKAMLSKIELALNTPTSRSPERDQDVVLGRLDQRAAIADCAYQLSIMFMVGMGGPQDWTKASDFLSTASSFGHPQATSFQMLLESDSAESSSLNIRRRLAEPRNNLLDCAINLDASRVASLLRQMVVPGVRDFDRCDVMGHALASMVRQSPALMMTKAGPAWQEQFIKILELLACPSVIDYFPNVNMTLGGLDFLSFTCRYSTEALKWLLGKYDSVARRHRFPRTFAESLPELMWTCMGCGYLDRVEVILEFTTGSEHLTSSHFFSDTIHRQPSLIPKYGELFKAAGAGAALFEVNNFGETAFDVALQYGFTDVLEYLLREGESYDTYRLNPDFRIDQSRCSPLASVLGYLKPVRFLLALNPKPNLLVTESGMNVFHVLASKETALGKCSSSFCFSGLHT